MNRERHDVVKSALSTFSKEEIVDICMVYYTAVRQLCEKVTMSTIVVIAEPLNYLTEEESNKTAELLFQLHDKISSRELEQN